ncbi:MAG: outer membrane protein assembly factor BamA [Prevotellaceae bacterium]|jgi:outer membrane protein insertion porin family|nr:outer membrane protein assembly factor BamA [Prevotellaceae bacterium]
MYKKQYLTFLLLIFAGLSAFAQAVYDVDYSQSPKKYEIAGISVSGADGYDNSVIIGYSELKVGQTVSVPGEEITAAVKRFWKHGMFADAKISVEKVEGEKIWLNIALKLRPKITEIKYSGVKKSQQEDLETLVGLAKGGQFTKNLENQTRNAVVKYFEEKGFSNVQVNIVQEPDVAQPNSVRINIDIDKKDKIKVNKISFEGNENLSARKLKKAMKNTKERRKILNIFKSKKFVRSLYDEDKQAIIDKYNQVGYRDAYLVSDTVIRTGKKGNLVNINIKVEEGKKYYFGNISWVGNTLYTGQFLNQMLRIKKGDVYNAKLLDDRIITDEDAVANLYQDNGYLFSNIEPMETNIHGDSIDFEMRVYEGKQAIINKIGIEGNTRVYDHVVRRELRTKPGQLYNKSDIMRTLREVAQMGFFDPEKIQPEILPDPENGTVDINYKLETKSSDQVELSAGYGATGLTGSLGLKFTNFAIENIFRPSTYKIVPQGEGQTLSLKATTNGSYYTSFSASFLDPWFGKKRPNSLSLSAYYSMQTGISDRSMTASNYYYSQMYGNSYAVEIDPDKYIHVLGLSLGWGTRLKWPDDYFTFSASLNYQRYSLNDWYYFIMKSGVSNDFNIGVSLSRNSIDNPIYTRTGSSFSISAEITPPYSLLAKKDYSGAMNTEDSSKVRYKWLEYHKWKISSKTFTPLTANQKFVLMTRMEYGFLGYYDSNYRSPFKTFFMGGDGMTGAATSYATDIIGLRGYTNGSLTPYSANGGYNGNLYTRLTMELHYPIVLEAATTIYALAFIEGGNCWANFKDFDPFNLKRSAGVGVRLFLPMFGMMGVDWGYGFDTVMNNKSFSGGHFNFVIGQEF